MAEFICDPVGGGGCNSISHEVKRKRVREHSTMKVWLAEEQLSGPNFMNNEKHAAIMVSAGTMNVRKSSYEALAAQGILE